MAEQLKGKLLALIPELDVGPKPRVLINEFLVHCCDTEHDIKTRDRASRGVLDQETQTVWKNYATLRYGFEVYFMGVRIYSKIKCRLWPDTS